MFDDANLPFMKWRCSRITYYQIIVSRFLLISYLSYVWILLLLLLTVTPEDVCWSIKSYNYFSRYGFFLIKLSLQFECYFLSSYKWPKGKRIHVAVFRNLKLKNCLKSMKVFSTNWERKFTNQVTMQAPNVNFRKISVRKTIWNLEHSEHFL